MKKNTIIYIIIVILLCALTGSITYIVATTNNKTETKEEKRLTISEEELKEYLKYIPKDIMNENQNMYINPQNSDELSIGTLLGATLNYADNYTNLRQETEYGDTFLFSKNEINNLMSKIYNKKPASFKNEIEYNCVFYSEYDNNYYLQSGGCGTNIEHISSIKSYTATEDELIIHEYAAYYDILENQLIDYYTKKETNLGGWRGNTTYEEKIAVLKNYLYDHQNEFTLYKHTFKKNDTGYYWYSTELASEE